MTANFKTVILSLFIIYRVISCTRVTNIFILLQGSKLKCKGHYGRLGWDITDELCEGDNKSDKYPPHEALL